MHTDMQQWNEIRHKVLVESVSKRQIRRDYRAGSVTLEKILSNSEPPGYRQSVERPKSTMTSTKPRLSPERFSQGGLVGDDLALIGHLRRQWLSTRVHRDVLAWPRRRLSAVPSELLKRERKV